MMPVNFNALAQKAMRDRVVVSQAFLNGFKVFAYPTATGLILGVGCDTDFVARIQPELILRKRSADPQRYGLWLPTLFNDGSCYVVRRFTLFDLESRNPLLTEDDLHLALELMA